MNLERIFHHILKPAMGCTESTSVAFAVAAAVQATCGWSPDRRTVSIVELNDEDVKWIRVKVNRNIFKNTFSAHIPNAEGHKGILMASALGAFGDPNDGLELFRDLEHEHVEMARTLIDEGRVTVEIVQAEHTDLYVHASVVVRSGSEFCMGTSLILDEHTNLVLLKRGQEETYHHARLDLLGDRPNKDLNELKESTIGKLVHAVEDLPDSVLKLIQKTIELNKKATEYGLSQPLGLGVGYHEPHSEEGLGLTHFISSAAAAGSDARMSGYPVEVMTSAGSGNQGIIATIPIVAYCVHKKVDEDRLLKAVALSHLMTMYVTMHIGFLSTLCGVAIKAGIGAACGITYAMGGGVCDISRSVKIMAASLSGIICDGAKPSCALKVSSSSETAVRAASLAIGKLEVSDENGIIASSAEATIRNLTRLNDSMKAANEIILQILQEKISRS